MSCWLNTSRMMTQIRMKNGEPVYIEDPAAPHDRRVPVYIGRCIRCDGYMTNALERYDGIKDDAVYRCLCCGWRTSPGYAENRAIHHKGL